MFDPLFRSPGTEPKNLVLPAWPVYVLFAGFPVFWVLGLGSFASVMCAIPMAALLYARRNIQVPIGFAFWVLFVLWAGIAVIEIDTGPRLIGYAVRLSNYLGATVLFIYAYNLKQEQMPTRRALLALAGFFAFVVVGGWLGVLFPEGSLTTPVQLVLPGSIGGNAYVQALVHPNFAEVQQPYGAPQPFYRPSAPFPYTNGWGCNIALLVPCMVAAVSSVGRRARLLIVAALALALVPAFATLNRGMFLAIGVGVAYAAIRLAMKGRVVPLVGLLLVSTLGAGFAIASGVLSSLQERLAYSSTNESRTTIYSEAFHGTVASPLLGNGAPRPSPTLAISIGTQGQIWNVMFSYGFLALFFFLAWFAWTAFASRGWKTGDDLWLHVCLVIAFMTIFYYGYDGPQLTVLMLVAALALRRVRAPREDVDEPQLPAVLGLAA